MIVGDRKNIDEIKEMVAPYKKVLIVGCETCVSICWAGGMKEVNDLAAELEKAMPEGSVEIVRSSVDRQCENEMVQVLDEQVKDADLVLSMACGAGAQTIAEVFQETPVFPGLNTTFLGKPAGLGSWVENCACCGDCVLDETGGICPVVVCAKGLMNGPCGGMRKGGMCEIDPEKPCAWVLIYDRLEKQGRLELMREYREPKDHRAVKRPGRRSAKLLQKA